MRTKEDIEKEEYANEVYAELDEKRKGARIIAFVSLVLIVVMIFGLAIYENFIK